MLRLLILRTLAAAAVVAPTLAFAPTLAVGQTAKPALDESALRYFASHGEKERVVREAQRLQRLDPAWHLPDDIDATRPGRSDEGYLWTLYAHDRMDDLDTAVALRKTAEPNWSPSDDLAGKIKTRKLRASIMALARQEDWHAIVTSFKGSGIAWAKKDAEVLWIVAEAYARENDCGEAFIVYRSILADHTDINERRATIEHAIALIPMSYTEKLIAMGGKGPNDGIGEFAPIAIDITRARISAFLHDEPANPVSDEELGRFQDFVRDVADPNEPGLVAWYAFKRHDYAQALDWFKLAIGHGGDAMVAHGLAHTLRKLDMKREAEEVAYAWREPLVNNSILFIDLLEEDLTKEQPPFIAAERVARYARVTMDTESGEGAQALGWYAYNTCQYPLALQWFERANAWLPKEATTYGLALAFQRLHRGNDFRDVVNRYDGLFPKTVALAFDDGIRKPPPPCESNARQPSAPPRGMVISTSSSGPDWTGRTMADTLKPRYSNAPALALRTQEADYTRARVPSPEAATGAGLPPLVKKTQFPVAVSPENPLRFSALRTVASEEQAHEARTGTPTPPLVARRVPGVGAMPYERYGFELLPGWDGTRQASSPTAAELEPPVGTLWALQQSLRDGEKSPLQDRKSFWPSSRPSAAVSDGAPHLPDRRS